MADNSTTKYPDERAGVSALVLRFAPAVLVGLAFLYLFKDAIGEMAKRWDTDPTFSHGWIVAPAAIAIGWFSKERWIDTPIKPAWSGFLIILLGVLMLLAGAWATVGFLPFVAVVVVLGGMLAYFGGWLLFKRLAFPYGFLWFMVPWPDMLVEQISFPMQLGTSTYAALLGSLVGIGIERTGSTIAITKAACTGKPVMFEVAVACSGMHSLVALLCLAAGFAYFTPIVLWKRWLLFLLGFPMAFIANIFRVFLILCVGNWIDPQLAAKAFHDYSAPVLFFINTLLLISLRNALMRKPAAAKASAHGAVLTAVAQGDDDAF